MSDSTNILPEPARGESGEGAKPVVPFEAGPAPGAYKVAPKAAVRIWSATTLAICGGMLGVGMWLTPSPTGTGTHRQLGLPPCGFYTATGVPCPTCGCTTAVSYFSHGHFINSFLTQPFGFTVALVAAILLPLCAFGLVTGKWKGPSMFSMSWYWQRWLYGGIAIFLFGWVFKLISVKLGHG